MASPSPKGRHPLQSQWSVWEHHEFQKKSGSVDHAAGYLQSMRKIYSFSSVEDFWRFWNNYPKASEIFYDGKSKKMITREGESQGKCVEAVSIFKTGIKPEWEDKNNRIGGEWTVRKISDVQLLNQLFENVVLAMIGETLDDEADVNGVRVVDKSAPRRGCHYRIEVWLKTADAGTKKIIRQRLEECMNEGKATSFHSNTNMTWKSHHT